MRCGMRKVFMETFGDGLSERRHRLLAVYGQRMWQSFRRFLILLSVVLAGLLVVRVLVGLVWPDVFGGPVSDTEVPVASPFFWIKAWKNRLGSEIDLILGGILPSGAFSVIWKLAACAVVAALFLRSPRRD